VTDQDAVEVVKLPGDTSHTRKTLAWQGGLRWVLSLKGQGLGTGKASVPGGEGGKESYALLGEPGWRYWQRGGASHPTAKFLRRNGDRGGGVLRAKATEKTTLRHYGK